MPAKLTFLCKSFLTMDALIFFYTRMSHHQNYLLRKGFKTVGALIWFLYSMIPHMLVKFTLLCCFEILSPCNNFWFTPQFESCGTKYVLFVRFNNGAVFLVCSFTDLLLYWVHQGYSDTWALEIWAHIF